MRKSLRWCLYLCLLCGALWFGPALHANWSQARTLWTSSTQQQAESHYPSASERIAVAMIYTPSELHTLSDSFESWRAYPPCQRPSASSSEPKPNLLLCSRRSPTPEELKGLRKAIANLPRKVTSCFNGKAFKRLDSRISEFRL
jgi:hypothetical protein